MPRPFRLVSRQRLHKRSAMLGTAGQSPGAVSLPPASTLHGLYAWLDRLPLSRPKRHLARDFSDGVMLAEIVKHFHPRLVDLHNYTPTCNTDQKLSNWRVLNRKVLHKLSFCVSETDIRKVVANRPGAIEPILCALRDKIESGTARVDLPAVASAGSGLFGMDTLQPQVDLATPTHTGLPRPPAPSSRKATQDGSALEKMGHCACRGWDPAGGPWEHPDPRTQHLLEDQEQALAVLQEMIKILQMKVVRLEHLVQLKDRQIAELARPRCEEHGGPPGRAPQPESARP
ncbi:sperm flagellar protein 1-like [Otolemur garnettii]|uniref:sperm flagellar protein 1-like n=1 Tax=Otolemur garnettii TaxID=30611 RepID=UPI000C7E97D2|nr:sperm flagellar protein 1-like [Otolemur garnettii]